jgi:hypothetical protein
MNTGLRMIVLLLAATTLARAGVRTWTFDASGKTTQGEVVGFTNNAVILKGTDGKTVSVPIAYFVESDRTYLAAERTRQWKQVEVLKLDAAATAGRYQKCAVRGTEVRGDIYVEGLPASVQAVLNTRNEQAVPIAELSARIENEDRAMQEVKSGMPAKAPRNRAYRRAYATQRAQLKVEAAELQQARAKLAELQKSYDQSVAKTKAQTMVKMRNTGVVYKGLPVWECLSARKPQE